MKTPSNSIFQIVARGFRLLDRETRVRAVISAAISVIHAGLEAMTLMLVFPLALALTDPQLSGLGARLAWLKTLVLGLGMESPILAVGTLLVGAIVVKNAIYLSLTWWQLGFVRNGAARLSCRILAGYMARPYLWHLTKNSAEIQRNVNISPMQIFTQIIFSSLTLFGEISVIVGAVSVLLYMEPLLSFLFFLFIGATGLIYHFAFSGISTVKGRILQDATKNILKAVVEALGAYKEAKLLSREQALLNTFGREKFKEAAAARVTSMIGMCPRSFLELALVAVILFGLTWMSAAYDGSVSIAVLGTFAAAAFRVMPIVSRLLGYAQNLKVAAAALETVEDDLNWTVRAGLLATRPAALVAAPRAAFATALEVRGVSFRFPAANHAALENVSWRIDRGKCVGVVGPTGAGKSTLVDVIMGFLTPDAGAVLLDGADITGKPVVWSGMLGYVPQSIYLLDDTIRRNVAFGIADAEIDEAQVHRCLEQAQILDFVNQLPDGENTIVGERGVRISGGQRQRIGIARALYSNPDILVLDEGTSALDGETEARLSAAIDGLRGEKTVILIAHRLSTVRRCDQIVCLENGRVIGQGTFRELAACNATFQAMLRHADLGYDAGRPAETAP